jgi:hypothetical protein
MTLAFVVLAAAAAALPARPTPEVVLGTGHGYRLERPAGWRLETFKGGYFMASQPFGGGVIIGHAGKAPTIKRLLKDVAVASVMELRNVKDVRIVENTTGKIGGVEGIRIRFAGTAADGQRTVAGFFTVVPMPTNDRLLSVFVRAVPAERLPEFEAVYETMLAAVTFEKD